MHALTASVPEREVVRFLLKSLVFVLDHPASTLLDFCASHLFISASIVESLHPRACIEEDPLLS